MSASWCDLFSSAKVCSAAIFETSFSYDKDIWIAATDYYIHFYIIMLFPLTAILQLINFTASNFLVYQGGGHIIFAFFAVRCPASRMVSAHLKEKY